MTTRSVVCAQRRRRPRRSGQGEQARNEACDSVAETPASDVAPRAGESRSDPSAMRLRADRSASAAARAPRSPRPRRARGPRGTAGRRSARRPAARPRARGHRQPGRPSTGIAISVAPRATCARARRALDVEPVRIRQLRAHRRQHQRRAREEQVPLADEPRALGERPQVRLLVASPARCPARSASRCGCPRRRRARSRLHEAAELRHQHLEPELERAREPGRPLVARSRSRHRRAPARPAASPRRTARDGAMPPRSSARSTIATRIGGAPGPASGAGVHHGSRGSCCAIASQPEAHVAHRARERALHRHQLRGDRALAPCRSDCTPARGRTTAASPASPCRYAG